MVFTGPVGNRRDSGGGHTRRAVLGAVSLPLLGVTAGCGLFDDDEPAPPPPPDPLAVVLAEAVTLAAAYDRIIVARPDLGDRLAPFATAHKAHVAELTRVIGPAAGAGPAVSAGPSGPPTDDPGAALAALRRAEQAAQKTAAAQCLQVPAAQAALAGSIAAARACHAEALR